VKELFNDNRIDELEQKVEGLIQTFRGIKDEKDKLREKVQTLEIENKQLMEKMAGLQGEKEKIMGKVKTILEKVEQIEA
jgi:regulator of replication initiation timing